MNRLKTAAFGVALAVGLVAGGAALAQPAPQPQPQQQPQGQPPHPQVMNPRLIRPQGAPGQGPGGQVPPPAHAKPVAEKPEAPEKECDGNWDHPAPINWYQGLLGVDNEKATKGSGLDKLLYRYHNDKDECDPLNQAPPFLAQAINFSILAFILVYFGKKPVLEGLAARKKSIMGDVTAAEALRADAAARLKAYEKQLSNLATHRTELEEEYRAQSSTEQKRILAEADEKRARMVRDAELRVEQELRQAQGELLREAIEQAVAAAEELLKKKVEQRDLDRLADDYLAGLGAALSQKGAAQKGGAA